MAETVASTSLPPPPTAAGAPGYENPPTSTAAAPTSTMAPPPTLAPMVIPQNTNPIPQAMDPMSALSPGGQIRRMAPEPNKRALYLGGLDARVTEEVLKQIFETTGHVTNVKIIPDKNYAAKGANYGFVEYDDPAAAERAMSTLNGRRVHQQEIKVNWAYQANTSNKEDTTNHFHIFVGDLSNEVNDEVLQQAFSSFGSVSEARVMWDMKTGRTRGYGFVAFRDRAEAESALAKMDGEWLGSRAIRCNWANQKGQPSMNSQQSMLAMGLTPTTPFGHHHFPTQGVQSYDMVVNQTPSWQTTCYVGNLTPYTTQTDLVPLFQNFGYVTETRFQSDRGFAFIKMDTHENAAMAICQLSGYNVNGRPLKCSWGKDRPPTGQFDSPNSAIPSASTPSTYNPTSPFGFPQYGAPTPMSAYPLSPQGPSPSARWADQMASPYATTPQAQFPNIPPQSAGAYGRGQAPSHAQFPPPAIHPQAHPGQHHHQGPQHHHQLQGHFGGGANGYGAPGYVQHHQQH